MSYEYQGFKDGTLFTLENLHNEVCAKDVSDKNITITSSDNTNISDEIYKIDTIEEIKRRIVIQATNTKSSNNHIITIMYDMFNAKVQLSDILTKHYTLPEVIQALQNNNRLRFRQSNNNSNIISATEYNELRFINCDWNNDTKKYESTIILDELDINSTFVLIENKEVTFSEAMSKLQSGECDSVVLIYNGKEQHFTVDRCNDGTFFGDEYGVSVVTIEKMLDGKWFVNEL